MSLIPIFRRQRQADLYIEFQASQSYIVRSCLEGKTDESEPPREPFCYLFTCVYLWDDPHDNFLFV